jgi:2-polyprenyl-3-methyl-5-hydroxy-6-metoxy-1,4-benzoquinol methylase
MDRYKETIEAWNKIAKLYQDKFMHLDLYNASYDFFIDSIPKHKASLLDVGCGPGNISKYLLTKRSDYDVQGIDAAPNMVELAKDDNPTANFKVMDCRQILALKTNYEGIVCGFCLPYLSKDEVLKFISDAYQLLNANGLLYISFVEGDSDKSGFQTGSSGDRIYFYYHSIYQLRKAFTDIGFTELKSFTFHYNKTDSSTELHTALILKKQTHVRSLT